MLRADGTLWLNYGDAYAANTKGTGGATEKQATNSGSFIDGGFKLNHGLKPKDLMLLPARVALALQADGWYLRSEIVWHKPNPMPESVADRPTSAHEKVFLLAKSPRYFFDAEAVREEAEYGRREQSDRWVSGIENGDGHRSGGGSVTGRDPFSRTEPPQRLEDSDAGVSRATFRRVS